MGRARRRARQPPMPRVGPPAGLRASRRRGRSPTSAPSRARSGSSRPPPTGPRRRRRMAWWGGTDRARRTQEALTAYQRANPNIEVATESVGWGDYWTRLATQVAGGNAPDLIQMDYRYIFEYARRRALKPLDE